MRLASAGSLAVSDIAALFREGFSDYQVPLQLSDAEFLDHVIHNDIDLACSRIALEDRPASLALIGRRDDQAWVGGMATVPEYRLGGLGERVLMAGVQAAAARGSRAVWLEVLEENQSAIALYDKLRFEHVRVLLVWSLTAPGGDVPAHEAATPAAVHRWIAEHRSVREPWQRGDAGLERMEETRVPLQAVRVKRDGETVGAAIFRVTAPDAATILQASAVDGAAATDTLLATAGIQRSLRMANVAHDDRFSRALRRLGGRPVARQLEMRLELG